MQFEPNRAIGIVWIKMAVLYLLLGIGLGLFMGATHDFALRPVHSHLNLLGWASMALAGLIYCQFPAAGSNMFGRVHFWLMNLSVPVMMASLAFVVTGSQAAVPVLVIAQFGVAGGVLAFACNVFLHLK